MTTKKRLWKDSCGGRLVSYSTRDGDKVSNWATELWHKCQSTLNSILHKDLAASRCSFLMFVFCVYSENCIQSIYRCISVFAICGRRCGPLLLINKWKSMKWKWIECLNFTNEWRTDSCLYSMAASALLPTETCGSSASFHLCRLFLNHMGYMAWEKRSVWYLACSLSYGILLSL